MLRKIGVNMPGLSMDGELFPFSESLHPAKASTVKYWWVHK